MIKVRTKVSWLLTPQLRLSRDEVVVPHRLIILPIACLKGKGQ